LIVRVCMGSSCHLKGSAKVVDKLRELQKELPFKLYGALCFGRCTEGICVEVNGKIYTGVNSENVVEIVRKECAE